jgi:hypothetical protein
MIDLAVIVHLSIICSEINFKIGILYTMFIIPTLGIILEIKNTENVGKQKLSCI